MTDEFWLAYKDDKDRKVSLRLEGFEIDQDTYLEWAHKEAVEEHFLALAMTIMEIEE